MNDQDQVLLEKLQLTRSMPVADQTRMVPDWDQACARFQQAWRDAMA